MAKDERSEEGESQVSSGRELGLLSPHNAPALEKRQGCSIVA